VKSKIIYIDKNNRLNLSKLRATQQDFVKSNLLHSGIVGGYQSGKSLSAAVKVITKLLQDPFVPIAYYLPTYGLIDDMLIPKFTELFDNIGIKFTHNKKDSKIITPYGEIWMRSMDTPDRIVSYSVGYSMIDEVDVVHANKREDAIKRISSRNSFKKSTKNSIDFVSTPEGYSYMYNFFSKNANDNKKLFVLNTLDNKENLGEGYIDGLRELYDEHQLKAYLSGEFINLTNANVYYKFNRIANHSNEIQGSRDTLYIGMDFNIGNMSAVVHIIKEHPIAVDELTGIYDTAQMCNIIKEKYPDNKIIIYPDASGKQRRTSTTTTDIEILKNAGFKVNARNQNPYVTDRVKNMNRMFLNGNNEINYYVNTRTCQEYTEALERMSNDKNGVPDKTSGFDHITDAGGYFLYYEYPLKEKFDAFW
jgi:hypothetical protein